MQRMRTLLIVSLLMFAVIFPDPGVSARGRHRDKASPQQTAIVPLPGELYGWATSEITIIDRYNDPKLSAQAKSQVDRYNAIRPAVAPRLVYQLGDSPCPAFSYDMPPVPDNTMWLCYTGERFPNVGGTANLRLTEDGQLIAAGVVYVHKFGGLVKGIGFVTCHEMMHILFWDHLARNWEVGAPPPSCLGHTSYTFGDGDMSILAIAYG